MDVIDISLELSDRMTVWPGVEPFVRRQDYALMRGDIVNESQISLDCHTGTHIDAPRHIVEGGRCIADYPLERLVGPALVYALPEGCHLITAVELEVAPIWPGCILLLKTRNSNFIRSGEFRSDFTAVSPEAARLLIERDVGAVGVDYLSIEPYGSQVLNTHAILLSNGIAILEGLCLENVEPGIYLCVALPLKIRDSDGAPARVILLR